MGGRCSGLFYLGTQPFLFCQHLQYSIITEINMIITVTGVIIVKMNLTPVDNQEVTGIDLSYVKVLFMLNTDKCSILGILGARACNIMSFMLEMFRDCIKLKLSILE